MVAPIKQKKKRANYLLLTMYIQFFCLMIKCDMI